MDLIKNYIFDFGNVLVRFDPEIIMRPYIADKISRDELASIVFDRKYWDRLDDGSLTETQVYELIKHRIPDDKRKAVKSVLEKWYYHLPVNKETEEFVDELKNKGHNVYILSNISKNFSDNYSNVESLKRLLSKFDGLVFSGREGIVKPKREIFELILRRFNLNPDETLFIDDSQKNKNGAGQAGLHTFLFNDDLNILRKTL